MATRGVSRRKRTWRYVKTTYRKYRPAVVTRVVQRTSPGATPEEVAAREEEVGRYLDGVVGSVDVAHDDLVDVDDEYDVEADLDDDARKARDTSKDVLRSVLSFSRQVARLEAEDDVLRKWALDKPVPDDPQLLLDYARTVKAAVKRNPHVVTPKEFLPEILISGPRVLKKVSFRQACNGTKFLTRIPPEARPGGRAGERGEPGDGGRAGRRAMAGRWR